MYKEKLDEVNQYTSYKNLNSALKKRVLNYYEFKYYRGKFFDENRIMRELNGPLKKVCGNASPMLSGNCTDRSCL